MNWLTQDISSNRKVKIISPFEHAIYYEREGRQKLHKIWKEQDLAKMRTFIQENKDNNVKLKEGFEIYKYDKADYKNLLKEEGIEITEDTDNSK